jgi:hypothetical protein
MEPWMIAGAAFAAMIGLTGLALAMDIIYSRTEDRRIRKHLGQEPRRPVRVRPVAELGFVVIAVGFVVVVLLVLHWAAPATN